MQKEKLLEEFIQAQSNLVVQTSDLPLGALADMVESDSIDLVPGFQRRERWNLTKQSALIESFLLNVPVPPVYLAEERDGTFTAIDGKQRLRAIADYLNNRFALKELDRLESAVGLRFKNLPTEIQTTFRLRPFIRVVTLLRQTDPTLKYEVFLRLNTGGEILNNQEIRNVAYRGPLNRLIYDLATNDFLKKQLKITGTSSAAYRSMADAEYVLRFFTLHKEWRNFSGKLAQEMSRFMAEHRKGSPTKLASLKKSFETNLERCRRIWGSSAFKRPEGDGWRDQMLAGMYDAQMLAVSELSELQFTKALSSRADVLRRTRKLFSDPEFEKAVRTGTNTPIRIRLRVSETIKILR